MAKCKRAGKIKYITEYSGYHVWLCVRDEKDENSLYNEVLD